MKLFKTFFNVNENKDSRGTIVAKCLFGEENMDYMFPYQDERPGICPVCHNLIEQIPDLDAVIKRKKGDFFVTYDGFALVSQKFKDFCESRNYPHLTFQEMTNMKGLYYFMPNDVFQMDTSVVRFFNYHECCNSFDSIIDNYAKKAPKYNITTNDFICRTNLFYGGQHCKYHPIIVGLDTAKQMNNYGLENITFSNVYE